ncbi:hypothetical protein TNCV_2056711 [Trichonephila clavipes]|nr:hypothetical protein TNCV_2056711 [Trichonephila clavipes]
MNSPCPGLATGSRKERVVKWGSVPNPSFSKNSAAPIPRRRGLYLFGPGDKTCPLRKRTGIPGARIRAGQVAFQAEAFIDVPVGSAVFGGRDEVRMVHRDANHFWVISILRNAGNGQFDRYRLATMVKHVGMCEKG